MSHGAVCTSRRTPSPLAIRRLSLGLHQAEVAASAGVSREHLSRLELGKSQPSLAMATALARALDTSPGELFPPRNANDPGVSSTEAALKESRVVTTDRRHAAA